MVKYFKIITTVLLVLVLTTGGTVVTSAMADEMPIFDNNNTSSVQNGPEVQTQFTISESCKITMIKTYHWNNGNGAEPGTIKLMDETGNVYGPWNTTGDYGMGNRQNCYWICEPDIILPAGSYKVIDSDPDTWSCNAGSNNAGFVIVYGNITKNNTNDIASSIPGDWEWFINGIVTFYPDGTLTQANGLTGKWRVMNDGTVVIEWSHGYKDTLTLSDDGKTLTGCNDAGSNVWGKKIISYTTPVNTSSNYSTKSASDWNNEGDAFYKEKNYEEAIKCFNKAIEMDSCNSLYWSNKGYTLYTLGRYEEAIECYDRVLSIAPEDDVIWTERGLALYELGRDEEALESFNNALAINPDYETAWTGKGLALYKLGRYEEALESFNNALALNPDYEDALKGKEAALAGLNSSVIATDPVNEPSNAGTTDQVNEPNYDSTTPQVNDSAGMDFENMTPPTELEEVIKQLEVALKNSDMEKVLTMIDPMSRENYRSVFQNHPEAFSRIAAIIGTRELIFLNGSYAEYLVKENEISYPMVFEKTDASWCLSSF